MEDCLERKERADQHRKRVLYISQGWTKHQCAAQQCRANQEVLWNLLQWNKELLDNYCWKLNKKTVTVNLFNLSINIIKC